MILSQLKRLRSDLEQTQHYIRRLEKDGENDKIPFYQSKAQQLNDIVTKLEETLTK